MSNRMIYIIVIFIGALITAFGTFMFMREDHNASEREKRENAVVGEILPPKNIQSVKLDSSIGKTIEANHNSEIDDTSYETIPIAHGPYHKEISENDEVKPDQSVIDYNNAHPNSPVYEVKLGGNSIVNSEYKFNNGVKLMVADEITPVTIKIKNKKLIVSAQIFNKEGKVVCEIEDNNWSINKNQVYKRNFDDRGIELIDEYKNVVLSANFISDYCIVVYGIFNIPGKAFIFFDKHGMKTLEYYPQAITIIEKREGKPWNELYSERAKMIPRTFSYIGKDWLGKRL